MPLSFALLLFCDIDAHLTSIGSVNLLCVPNSRPSAQHTYKLRCAFAFIRAKRKSEWRLQVEHELQAISLRDVMPPGTSAVCECRLIVVMNTQSDRSQREDPRLRNWTKLR